jgi:hypothetical protein
LLHRSAAVQLLQRHRSPLGKVEHFRTTWAMATYKIFITIWSMMQGTCTKQKQKKTTIPPTSTPTSIRLWIRSQRFFGNA